MLSRTRSVVVLLIAIAAIVIIHEFGHFVTAQFFGVRTPVFSIGFGPKLFGITIKGTTFQIAALPLGGFVSMNMQDLEQKPYWQKMIIILAGILNNIILTFIALTILLSLNRRPPVPIIARTIKKSPAQKAGLHSSDHIIGINNQSIPNIDFLMHVIHNNPNKTVHLMIKRNGELLDIPAQLDARILIGSTIGYLGAEFKKDTHHAISITQTIKNAITSTIMLVVVNVRYFIQLLRSKPQSTEEELNSLAVKNIQTGFSFFLFFVAYTSVQIGLFNLLPIPMLDGGQAFQYSLQRIFGSLLSADQIIMLHYTLIVILVMLILLRSRTKKK